MRQTKMSNFNIEKKWYVVDATDLVLGRMSTEVALILMGKNKPEYTPHLDNGDYVIILNASRVLLTGNKEKTKKYYNYSGHPSGMRVRTAGTMKDKYPVEMIQTSIKGMLPKTALGKQMMRKLFVYDGDTHKHEAQQPILLDLSRKAKK